METELSKWGNSLAVRIPAALAKQLHLREHSHATLQIESGALVLRPVSSVKTLSTLIASLSACNAESEISSGPELGNESATW